jgi:hypothetical protein
MNRYRVDRAPKGPNPPVGMNSILYIGDDAEEARRVYDYAHGRKDSWGQPDPDYGIMLSYWCTNNREYRVTRWKNQ